MKNTRRDFIKIGGLSLAATGLVAPFLQSCAEQAGDTAGHNLQNEVAGVEPLTQEDYAARLDRLVDSMIKEGIEALFMEGSTNLRYFFNMSWWLSERTFGPVINTKKEPVWICPDFELERAKEQIPEGHEIRTWAEHESPFDLLAGIVSDLGLDKGKTAMGPSVRSFLSEGFQRSLGTDLLDGSMAVNMVRAIKTEKEQAYMDLANNITKKAYRYAFERLEEGMTREDLGNHIRFAHSEMGTSGSGGPSFGFTSAFPHGTRQVRHLHEGDIVLVDGGCSVEGFRSDVTRTTVFGKASDRQKEVFNVVLKAQQEAHRAVKPGIPCGEIDRVARKVIEDAGFGPGYKYFAHRLGHGIGMDGHEYPYLVKDNPLLLQPGMTFSNEPGIYIYGEFGVRIEDCFVVTEDGARMFGGMLTQDIEHPFGEA
ncbi:MAG: Xaa-Pro peptidase family protein [Bacteroidales bacterium]|jgi:Xaa-Pro dipeptidase|nr:Xaa-Pro peptidase family protein [Bacteroidales bacterium]